MIDWISNRIPLKHRIRLGYLFLFAIVLIISGSSYLGFQRLAEEFDRFGSSSRETQLGLELARQIADLQRTAEIFTHEGHQSAAEQVDYGYRAIHRLIEQSDSSAVASIHPYLEQISRHLERYYQVFLQLREQRVRQSQLVSVDIRKYASLSEQKLRQHLAAIPADQIERQLRLIQLLSNLLLVEKYAYRYFDSLDAANIASLKRDFGRVRQGLEEVFSLTEHHQQREDLRQALMQYESKILEAVQRTRGYLYLVNVVMAAEAYEILYQSRKISALLGEEMNAAEGEINRTIDGMIQLGVAAGVIFLLLVSAMSLLIGKSITLPIDRLTHTFRRLAQGAGDTEIPVYNLNDELGELTRAAEVFRQKNNETLQLMERYQRLSEDLELMVQRRTQQLADSNRELMRAKDAAEASTRAKSVFLANMSHEIRTPMHAITGMTYLARQTELNPEQQGYLQAIDNAAKALLTLLNDILDLSKIEAGRLELEQIAFDLPELLEQVGTLVEPQAKKKSLGYRIDYPTQLPRRFVGDPTRLRQVLINLLGNAVKFTERGEVGVAVKQQEGMLCLRVWDTGIGMSMEQQKHLFQHFSQADTSTTRKYGGSGLGLAISKQLVELMGGRIGLESTEGSGSCFSFALPLEVDVESLQGTKTMPAALPQRAKEHDLRAALSQLAGKRILLVEDNPMNRTIIHGMLRATGLVIEDAENGALAVERFGQGEADFDLVLMDVQMPVMGGYEATRRIREFNPLVPIIALTADVMVSDVEQSRACGMNEHLNKPIEVERLFGLLLEYLGPKEASGILLPEQVSAVAQPSGTEQAGLLALDTRLGLQRMGDDRSLYRELLDEFLRLYSDVPGSLQASLARDREQTLRLIHSIKGISGTLGAMRLFDIAAQIQVDYRPELVQQFETELSRMCEDVRLYLSNQSG